MQTKTLILLSSKPPYKTKLKQKMLLPLYDKVLRNTRCIAFKYTAITPLNGIIYGTLLHAIRSLLTPWQNYSFCFIEAERKKNSLSLTRQLTAFLVSLLMVVLVNKLKELLLTNITLFTGYWIQPSGQDSRYIHSLIKVKSKMELQSKS